MVTLALQDASFLSSGAQQQVVALLVEALSLGAEIDVSDPSVHAAVLLPCEPLHAL
jgi:hypothetical protein